MLRAQHILMSRPLQDIPLVSMSRLNFFLNYDDKNKVTRNQSHDTKIYVIRQRFYAHGAVENFIILRNDKIYFEVKIHSPD